MNSLFGIGIFRSRCRGRSTGMRPVVEIMYPDFTLYAADSIANQAAKYRYMCGGGDFRVPVVCRIAGSGSSGESGCHHGPSLEATFIHFPGLKVVFAGTPYDAKGLIKMAIQDDNPVLFYEHKLLYRVKGEVPEEESCIAHRESRRQASGEGCHDCHLCMDPAQGIESGGPVG